MDQELFQVKKRKERSWENLRNARGDDKLHWAVRIFADGLAEDEFRVACGDRGRLSQRLADAPADPGGSAQSALFSRAQEQAARVVALLQRAGLPRVADTFLDRTRVLAPELMGCFQRWISRQRAINALLDGWSPAGRLAALALPDREGLEDLLQLLTGALYLDLDEGLAEELSELWPLMYDARDVEPRLFDVVAALVRDVTLADHLRQQETAADQLTTRLPSLLDHLVGRVRGAFRPEQLARARPTPQLVLDLERITLELAGELYREAGWPAGRALLARRMLAHCLVTRPDVHVAGRGVLWSGLAQEPDCPLRVLPPAREVLAVLIPDPRLDLAGQYQGAALVMVLPAWLGLLVRRGLLSHDEIRDAGARLGTLLASPGVQRHVWDLYYDPTLRRHLGAAWFHPRTAERQACQVAAY